MSEKPVLYRKRLIPSECIRLDSDEILLRSGRLLVTRWKTIRPKKTLSHGASCYLLDKGWKISRFLDHEDRLICWYCDIIDYSHDAGYLHLHRPAGRCAHLSLRRDPRRRPGRSGPGPGRRTADSGAGLRLHAQTGRPAPGNLRRQPAAGAGGVLAGVRKVSIDTAQLYSIL